MGPVMCWCPGVLCAGWMQPTSWINGWGQSASWVDSRNQSAAGLAVPAVTRTTPNWLALLPVGLRLDLTTSMAMAEAAQQLLDAIQPPLLQLLQGAASLSQRPGRWLLLLRLYAGALR